MHIISYNLNGIRSALRKGFFEWLREADPDIICLQEIKATEADLDSSMFHSLGYRTYWYPAQKKGYSGVAVFSKKEPQKVNYGNACEQSDSEGRFLSLEFGDFTIINTYFPSGTSGEIRQAYKYQWLDEFFEYIAVLRQTQPNLVVCGDYNICHKPIDIHDPVSNKKSSGFLPEERAWMDKWFESGFSDTFRVFNSNPHEYSWWSQRAASRERNKGWRIDYISVSQPMHSRLKSAAILQDIKHSDHCPVAVVLES